jgi:hypothetical protein
VIEAPADGGAVIAEEHHACMIALRRVAQQVKDGIVVEEEVLGVTPL